MPVSTKEAHKIIAYTAKTESGGKFNSLNPDDTGAGISFGLIQFNQAGGRLKNNAGSPLAALFKEMYAASPAQFAATFGPYASNMLNQHWVQNTDLNTADFKARLKASAEIPAFQTAQLEQARKGYFAPAEAAAKKYGIKSQRGHAMLFDTSVQWGPARMERFLKAAVAAKAISGLGAIDEKAVLTVFATAADDGKYERRRKMLVDGNLSDASVIAAGGAGLAVIGVLAFVGYRLWFRG